MPFAKPTMPCFGGPLQDTMLVTSIALPGRDDDPWNGAVALLRPGAQGVAETMFAG